MWQLRERRKTRLGIGIEMPAMQPVRPHNRDERDRVNVPNYSECERGVQMNE